MGGWTLDDIPWGRFERDRLDPELVRIVKAPDMREKLTQQGADPVASSPEEFAAYIRAETAKWAKVVKLSAAKAE